MKTWHVPSRPSAAEGPLDTVSAVKLPAAGKGAEGVGREQVPSGENLHRWSVSMHWAAVSAGWQWSKSHVQLPGLVSAATGSRQHSSEAAAKGTKRPSCDGTTQPPGGTTAG